MLLTVAFFTVILFSNRIEAAPETTSTITSTDAVYVDPGQPTSNVNNGLIFISGNGAGGTSNIGLLKFNLSSVGYTINKARLNLAIVSDQATCGFTSDASVSVNIYQVDNTTWTETGVTYNTKPTRGNFIMSATVGTTVPSHLAFSDTGGGNLSSYLETERSVGAGNDGIAGIWIETTAGANQVVFEDDEGTGATAGCSGANLVPTLQLADSADPLAITLASLTANRPSTPLARYILFTAMIGLAAVALVWMRRR